MPKIRCVWWRASSSADASGPRVAWEVVAALAPMHGDPALLLAVWRELLDNAWRHARAHPAPRVEVSCRAVPGGHVYTVSDNGHGFDPEHAAALFGLFQHRHGPPDAGLGVGLAMVRRIIECHGGTVWATSSPGQGARFSFSLPSPGPTV
jgi:signal transduction histidine kinase